MHTNLEISQEAFDQLIDESIGHVDVADHKLVDKMTAAHTQPTTTVLPTFGLC